MSYTDFYIRKEHTFLRNIFPEDLKDLPTYYDPFQKFLNIIIYMKLQLMI